MNCYLAIGIVVADYASSCEDFFASLICSIFFMCGDYTADLLKITLTLIVLPFLMTGRPSGLLACSSTRYYWCKIEDTPHVVYVLNISGTNRVLQMLYCYSQGFSTVTCGKTRDGNRRQISIQVSDGKVDIYLICRCTQAQGLATCPVKAHI